MARPNVLPFEAVILRLNLMLSLDNNSHILRKDGSKTFPIYRDLRKLGKTIKIDENSKNEIKKLIQEFTAIALAQETQAPSKLMNPWSLTREMIAGLDHRLQEMNSALDD